MKKFLSLLFVSLLLIGLSCPAQAASIKIPNALDVLVEAPDWIANDKDAMQILRFDVPKMIPANYPYGSDPENILEAAKDHRNRYNMFDKKTKLPFPLSGQDLIKITGDLRGEYLLYALYEPESQVNTGPWDSLTNLISLKIIIVNGKTKEVLFEQAYSCIESADDTIEVTTRTGIQTRKGDPTLRLSPAEAVKVGLRKATPEVKSFLEKLRPEK